MDEREVTSRVLEEDEDLVGFDSSKYVFTDITFGVPGTAGQSVSLILRGGLCYRPGPGCRSARTKWTAEDGYLGGAGQAQPHLLSHRGEETLHSSDVSARTSRTYSGPGEIRIHPRQVT